MSSSNIVRSSFTHRALSFSYLDSAPGDTTRPVLMLLHGFPDEALMWEPMIGNLHQAGFRVIAPDTIGCGQTEMGAGLGDYALDLILSDKIALLDHLGVASVHLVGHDWGAVLAWLLAAHFPDRVQRLCAISVGHPASYVRGSFKQKLMSWYIVYFHFAGLSERLLMGHGRFGLNRVFGPRADMDAVLERLAEPGRLTAALRIYRANVLRNVLFRKHPRVRCPTLAIHSKDDALLEASQVQNSRSWVDASFKYVQLEGSHWIPMEQAGRLHELMLEHFLRADTSKQGTLG